MQSSHPLERSVGVSAVNALSHTIMAKDFLDLLPFQSPGSNKVGFVGPSAGWLPQPAFRRGVHAVAATKITDLAGARRTILEGGGTPQFIRYGQKYTLIPD